MDAISANIRQGFPGYRNREDVATLSPNIMVVGSKNVLTNTYKRVGSRGGYTLDGQRSTVNSGQGIYGTFDWDNHIGYDRHVRAGFNSTGTNGVVQFRYKATAGDKYKTNTFTEGQVYWIDLLTGAGSTFNACRFWDYANELKDMMLWVDGTSNIFSWTGAVATVASTSWTTGSVSVVVATPTAAGTGYSVNDILTISTGGTGATVKVLAIGIGGAVTAVQLMTPGNGYIVGGPVSVVATTPTAAGTGYSVNDILTISTGGTGATVKVLTIGLYGEVTSVQLMTPGNGYTAGVGKATTYAGAGRNCTIEITTAGVGKATTYAGAGRNCTIEITTVVQGYIGLNGATNGAGALGFMSSGNWNQFVSVNGNTYSYTGIVGSYLTGIGSDPTAEAAQSVIFQRPNTHANSGLTGLPATFKNTLIENLNNQIYITASDNNSVYVSLVNTFTVYTFSSPRKPGEGAILTLDGVPSMLQQQSDSMFISAGKNYWYVTKFQASSDLVNETLNVVPIKTTANQACRSDDLSVKIKNLIAFVSYETQINTIGIAPNFFDEPQVLDLSFPIVHDVQNTDFTGGQMLYFQKFLLITIPLEGKMLIYNMTNDTENKMVDVSSNHYWEAPQILPFGKLSIIDGAVYGHAANESNTFKLFDGLSDDGKPYKCVALFAYDTYGDRTSTKASNQFFIEGYKKQDTELTAMLRRELNGPVASWKFKTLPDRCLTPVVDDVSIGKSPIGKSPIGGTLEELDLTTPPKFRLIQTFDKMPYFEEQVGFSSENVGQWWELVAYSTNATNTIENQSSIFDPNEGNLN